MKITFFELKAMYLTELYSLLAMSLETGDFVSEGMALRIEKRIVKGANKTWKKLFRKHKRKGGFYSLHAFNAPKSEPPPPIDKVVETIPASKVQIESAPPMALLEQTNETA